MSSQCKSDINGVMTQPRIKSVLLLPIQKNLKLTVCVQNIVTYEAFCKHNIRFFNVGLQPRLCATCRVYCVGSLVSAQSDKAEPDMSIARLNKPGKTKSITGCCLVNKTENMFAPLQQNYANSDFRGKLKCNYFQLYKRNSKFK